ncbi:hypothetical protein [Nodularia spumigena]|uniref:hypothetical protein n=1 Tax=Nodularia spumigena TaxID=70799 RepID=UPI002B213C7B|nr:hypothetical protein [Nodularia spumigena]MEA5556264.1 hypothetical protein [Nodularia spumigena CH309]
MRTTSRRTTKAQGLEGLGLDLGALESEEEREQTLALVFRVLEAHPEAGARVEIVIDRASLRITSDVYTGSFDTAGGTQKSPPHTTRPARTPAKRPPGGTGGASTPGLDALFTGMDDETLRAMVEGMVGGIGIMSLDAAGRATRMEPHPGTGGVQVSSLAQSTGGTGARGRSLLEGTGIAIPFGDLMGTGHPTGLVSPGETWTNADALGTPGLGAQMTTRYKVQSVRQSIATVGVEGTMEPRTDGTPPGLLPGLGLRACTFRGEFGWDTRSGSLSSMDFESEISIDLAGMSTEMGSLTTVRRQR